jgi:hypothetical protein
MKERPFIQPAMIAEFGDNVGFAIEMAPITVLTLDPDDPRRFSKRELNAAKRVLMLETCYSQAHAPLPASRLDMRACHPAADSCDRA